MTGLMLESALQQGIGDCSVIEGGYKSCYDFSYNFLVLQHSTGLTNL